MIVASYVGLALLLVWVLYMRKCASERDAKGRYVKRQMPLVLRVFVKLVTHVTYVVCVLAGLAVGACATFGAFLMFAIYVQGTSYGLPEDTCGRRVQVLSMPTGTETRTRVLVCNP